LAGYKNFVGEFIYLEPVQRSEDGCDMRIFRSFNHSTCKTVLDLPKSTFFDRLYFGPYRVLATEIFTRARLWQSLTSAHSKPGLSPIKIPRANISNWA